VAAGIGRSNQGPATRLGVKGMVCEDCGVLAHSQETPRVAATERVSANTRASIRGVVSYSQVPLEVKRGMSCRVAKGKKIECNVKRQNRTLGLRGKAENREALPKQRRGREKKRTRGLVEP
jgi:hypothetical protein